MRLENLNKKTTDAVKEGRFTRKETKANLEQLEMMLERNKFRLWVHFASKLHKNGPMPDWSQQLNAQKSDIIKHFLDKINEYFDHQHKPLFMLADVHKAIVTTQLLGAKWPELDVIQRRVDALIDQHPHKDYMKNLYENAVDAAVLQAVQQLIKNAFDEKPPADAVGYMVGWCRQASLKITDLDPAIQLIVQKAKHQVLADLIDKLDSADSDDIPFFKYKIKEMIGVGLRWPELVKLYKTNWSLVDETTEHHGVLISETVTKQTERLLRKLQWLLDGSYSWSNWIPWTKQIKPKDSLPDWSEQLRQHKHQLLQTYLINVRYHDEAGGWQMEDIIDSINTTKRLGANWPELDMIERRINATLKSSNSVEEAIDWQDLKRKAAGAALAGGLVGAAAVGLGPKTSTVPQPVAPITAPIAQPSSDVNPESPAAKTAPQSSAAGTTHPRFPEQLRDIERADPRTRVDTFKQVLLPAIDSQNNRIRAQRSTIVNLAKSKQLTHDQKAWLDDMMAQYKAKDLQDLLKRVDTIPRSMALAQAAIESGWGTDPKTQKANVFYGQKTWDKNAGVEGPYGERYAGFESPEAAVRAYMRNLNTHDAYAGFRDQRAQMRRTGVEPSGKHLVNALDKYSTLGKRYTHNVKNIITSKGLDKLDTAVP